MHDDEAVRDAPGGGDTGAGGDDPPPRQLSLFDPRPRTAVLGRAVEGAVRSALGSGLDTLRRAVAAIRPAAPGPAAAPSPGRPPRTGTARRPRLRTQGRSCDLAPLLAELNGRFFGGQLTAAITWGRRRPRRRSRRRRSNRVTMQLGSYHPDQDLIRIHPALDRPWVPRYVLEAVIHHELLHAALPPTVRDGRRRLHTPEFRRRERDYPHHDRAQAWIRDNLRRLIEQA